MPDAVQTLHDLLYLSQDCFSCKNAAEDYTEDQSIAHVRRLLDLFSCTTHFGAFSKHNDVQLDQGPIQALSVDEKVSPDTDNGNTNSPQITHDYEGREGQPVIGYTKRAPQGGNPDGLLQVSAGANQDEGTTPATSQEFSATAVAAAREASERGDMCSLCPPSELGQFYEFFSLSHVTPPIQCQWHSPHSGCRRLCLPYGPRVFNLSFVIFMYSAMSFNQAGKTRSRVLHR